MECRSLLLWCFSSLLLGWGALAKEIQPLSRFGTSKVQVTVHVTGMVVPSQDDLVALYSPPDMPPDQRAPIKFQYLNKSEGYLDTGKATLVFRLINMREAYSFSVFTGGIANPVLVSSCPQQVRFVDPNEPLQVHLALAGDGPGMRVTWASRHSPAPIVQYQRVNDQAKRAWKTVMATSMTFTEADLCGGPASTVGFHAPGLIHTAIMAGLAYDTTYVYTVGDQVDHNTSPQYKFRTPPSPATASTSRIRVGIFGDLGRAEQDSALNFASNEVPAINSTEHLTKALEQGKLDLVVHIGDISYATGYLSEWDGWFDLIRKVSPRVAWMTAIGNHERDSSATSVMRPEAPLMNGDDSGGECGVPYAMYLPMPPPADDPRMDTPWYSFDYGPCHFTVMSTEHDFHPGSTQYAFLKQDLTTVDREERRWLLFLAHRPLYIDSTDSGRFDADQVVAEELRKSLEPLLYEARVDLVLTGHHHSYQRTCQVLNGTCLAPSTASGQYHAPVHTTLGMAGRTLHENLEWTVPSFMEKVILQWGMAFLEVGPEDLSITLYADVDGRLLDHFTLSQKAPESPPSPWDDPQSARQERMTSAVFFRGGSSPSFKPDVEKLGGSEPRVDFVTKTAGLYTLLLSILGVGAIVHRISSRRRVRSGSWQHQQPVG